MISHLGQVVFESLMAFVSFGSMVVLFGSFIGIVIWMFIKFAAKD